MTHRSPQARPVLLNEVLEARFLNGGLPAVEGVDRPMVHVDADDVVTLARDGRRHARAKLAEAHDRKSSRHNHVDRMPKSSQPGSTRNRRANDPRSSSMCDAMNVTTPRVLSYARVTSSSGRS